MDTHDTTRHRQDPTSAQQQVEDHGTPLVHILSLTITWIVFIHILYSRSQNLNHVSNTIPIIIYIYNIIYVCLYSPMLSNHPTSCTSPSSHNSWCLTTKHHCIGTIPNGILQIADLMKGHGPSCHGFILRTFKCLRRFEHSSLGCVSKVYREIS